MNYPTFTALEAKLKNDLDLNEETFIQEESFVAYYDEAVSFVEAKIHTLYEDYFKTRAGRDVTAAQTEIALPSNIYANKIRKIFWNGDDKMDRYEIKPIKDQAQVLYIDDNDRYRYDMLNDGTTDDVPLGVQMIVYPAFRETKTGATTATKPILIYYLRSANRYVDEDSVCDIPEFSDVINQYVTYKCRKKEGHPLTELEKADLQSMLENMIETLMARRPDENNELTKDLSFYDDFDPYYLMF